MKSSRKYVPLTQGNGLNPNHDRSSTERDVPHEFGFLRNKLNSRGRKQLTFFLYVYSCNHGRIRSGRTPCVDNESGMCKAGFPGDDAPRAVPSDAGRKAET